MHVDDKWYAQEMKIDHIFQPPVAEALTSLVAEATLKHFWNFAQRHGLCVFKNSTSTIARSSIAITGGLSSSPEKKPTMNSWTLHALSICCHHRIDMRLNFSSSIYQKPFLIFIHKQKKSITFLFLFYLSHIPCNSNLSPSASEETWQGSRKMNVTVRTKGGWRQISKTSRNFQKDSKQFTRINVDNQPFCIGKTKA